MKNTNKELMMIPTKRHFVDEELKKLTEYSRSMSRGELIKHAEIESITGMQYQSAAWNKLIKKWKEWTMDKLRISISPVPGIGYRFNNEHQQLEQSLRLEKQGVKRTLQAGLIAGVIEEKSLDETMGALQKSVVQRAASTRTRFNEVIAERRSLLSKQESLPRIELSGVR